MNPGAKLGAFGVVLALAVGGGTVAGSAVGRGGDRPTDARGDHGEAGAAAEDRDAGHGGDDDADAGRGGADAAADTTGDGGDRPVPAGLQTSEAGYLLALDEVDMPADRPGELRFRIVGPDGEAVRDFEPRHERELHLIVASADLATYRHIHPELAADGTWTAELPPSAPGVYRAFADFAVAGGPELTLGVDLPLSGDARYAPLPAPAEGTRVDGYEVSVAGTPVAGETSELTFAVTRDGRPVADLEPYLGAFGHLVAIRSGDLAYLHVHPLGDEPDAAGARGGPDVRFGVEVPSPGDYRLFFEFARGGDVHTAALTVHVPPTGEARR